MAHKAKKYRYTFRDYLTAYLVVFVIVGTVALGAAVLYMSGIFDPVEVGPALADTEPIELPTVPPRGRLVDWLFPAAMAEEAEAAEQAQTAAPDGESVITPQAPEDLEQLLEDIVAEETEEPEVPAEEQVTVGRGDLSINENLPTDVYNVLLLATDSRDINSSRGRSDVMIIASVNMSTNEVRLVSLSRDLYVPITDGVGNKKLNAAYAYGGPELAIKTINALFELNVRDYALVNFSAMAGIVDALGGVDLYLEADEYLYINENVAVSEDYEGFAKSAARQPLTERDQETVVHLDGLQALGYARIRKLDSDINRTGRQRMLLQALTEKGMRNLSPATFYSLANSLMSSVNTNMTLIQVMDIGKWVLEAGEITIQEMTVPVADTWHYAREDDVEVITFNLEKNVQALHEFLYGEYIPAAAAQ